jgi:CRISPR-associated protein Csc3
MEESLEFTEKLVREYRKFYKVHTEKSSHSILLPLTKALEIILLTPVKLNLKLLYCKCWANSEALDRQEVYKRPFLLDKSLDIATRRDKELEAIHTFMSICVNEVFSGVYKGDRALLQENRNLIKSGAEFAYRG